MPLSAWSTPSAIVQFASPTLLNASMFFPSNNVVHPPGACASSVSDNAAVNTMSPATTTAMRFIQPPVFQAAILRLGHRQFFQLFFSIDSYNSGLISGLITGNNSRSASPPLVHWSVTPMQTITRRTFAAAVMGAACIAALGLITLTAAETSTVASNYVFDPTFPKLPLPNKWTFGGVQALAIDKNDVLWVSHRPNDLNETENFASLNPPLAECCVKGPAILA